MRLNTRTWIWLGLVVLVGLVCIWRVGEQGEGGSEVSGSAKSVATQAPSVGSVAAKGSVPAGADLKALFAVVATNAPNGARTNLWSYRLSNTPEPLSELVRNDRAVLLRHAFIDTGRAERPQIPAQLRAQGEPGSYIIQAHGVITAGWREWLERSGAEIVSYVPNNAFLARASAGVARYLEGSPAIRAVLVYEPYYKLDGALLALAVKGEPSPHGRWQVVAFPRETARVRSQLEALGAVVVGEPEGTVFGEVLVVKAPADAVAAVARIAEVQMVGVHFEKRPANDLSRVKLRVSRETTTPPPTSHYGAPTAGDPLTGAGVLVAVADTGVDGTHPDFSANRVFGLTTDFDGHGTHVIGSLLGNGSQSLTVLGNGTNSNAKGSTNGAYFTGIAPDVRALVMDYAGPNDVLQRRAALTNALISNNSWGYPDNNDYDIVAASYDAAVRDSLPGVTGEQEVAYVFAGGNNGGGGNDGLNGLAGSVVSPATAKNVITVGGIDQARFITNQVVICRTETNNNVPVLICETSAPWLGNSDSDHQVSRYSARGNVGVGIEGSSGRVKPDVVAPGSWVVSTRSKDYRDPVGSATTTVFEYNFVPFAYRTTNLYSLNIPNNATNVTIQLVPNTLSPPTNVDLLIGADIDNIPTTFLATNRLNLGPATTPALRGGTLYYIIGNPFYSNTANFDLVVLLTVTNNVGNEFEVLSNLNSTLKPFYRYESGTSMAAAKISGLLALMQGYLTNHFSLRPSPALLKALLINGARSLSLDYNLDAHAAVNHQGWGLANISNSIPSGLAPGTGSGPLRFFEQSTTNALATGGTHTYEVTVPEEARSHPLRLSLVWSDPPGNPVASVKLVNDLNLTVLGDATNAITTNTSKLIWVGNNFPAGSDFTSPITTVSTDTNSILTTNVQQTVDLLQDPVNNVENVYIRAPLSSSYTVVVKGHRVNVNANNSHSNSLVQDYALVIASGNVAPANNVNLAVSGPVFTNDPSPRLAALIARTNTTTAGLLNQRVGANAPLITSTNGASNQWAFFTYTNQPNAAFRYVAILTFFPPELSLPRVREADIDLYVTRSTDGTGRNLFQLDPAAISASTKATSRGGSELIIFTNAGASEAFSIGVKSEDQQAAQFSIFAVSSQGPFSSRDASNNIVSRAFPLPADIPDGTPENPAGVDLFAIVVEPPDVTVQRLYVTNSIFHEEAGDIIGILSHTDPMDGTEESVTLNDHRTWTGLESVVYDDSDQGDLDDPPGTAIPPVIPPDGPGSLRNFVGQGAFGVWNFSVSDNAMFHTGVVAELTLVIEPASTNADNPVDLVRTVLPRRWVYAGFNVPADATNVQICVSETDGPVDLYVRRGDFPTLTLYDKALTNIAPPGACMDLGLNDSPPLNPGRYFVGVYNPGVATRVRVHLVVTIQRSLTPNRGQTVANDTGTYLTDDATTNSTLFVTNRGLVTAVEVDVRIDHPRASDLALHLISPQGTRLLLAENRGRDSTTGYGWTSSNTVVTNFGARILDEGFDNGPGRCGYPPDDLIVGEIHSGWRVVRGSVDVMTNGCGFIGAAAHSQPYALDIDGQDPGTIETNITTVPGRRYQLSFAYTQIPGFGAKSSRIHITGLRSFVLTSAQPNSLTDLMWQTTSIVFTATSSLTLLQLESLSACCSGGMYFDTFRMDEVEIVTNSTLYATFTDDTVKAILPIKFAPPPFGDTNFNGRNVFINGFERTTQGVYSAGRTFLGWTVRTNTVYVRSNSILAYSDTNYLLLRTGTVSRVLPTVAGKQYVLQFATRTSRQRIYSTGVDEDNLPLPSGSVDSHYFVSSNSFTRMTNVAYLLDTNSPPMGDSWINRELPDSRWIGVDANTPPPGANRYGFKTQFDLTGYNRRSVSLIGRFQGDGAPVAILLNGVNIPSAGGWGTSYRTGFITRVFTNGFVQGVNTLEFVLTNAPTPVNNTALGLQAHFAPDAIQGPQLGLVTFDDLPTVPLFDNDVGIPNGYQGFQWQNFYAVYGPAQDPTNGYYLGTVSTNNVAFNGYGTEASISRASPFNFSSAYFTAAFTNGLPIRSQGFVGTTLVYDTTNTLNVASPTLISFDYRGVTRVTFTPIPPVNRNQFVMDNALIDPVAPLVYTSIGQVKLVGSYTNYFTASSDFWRMQNVTFTARSNTTVLEFTGITPGVWLDHIQMRETGRKYYLPEEPFTPLIGQQAAGEWKLEVWDSRLGAAVGNAQLISWRLNLEYVRTNPPLTVLGNHLPVTGTVPAGGLRHFAVDVTCDSANVTNTLMSLSPPGALDLLFNQDTFASGSEPGDFVLIPNTLSNAVARQVGQFPLLRSGRYFLAVRNTNPTPVDFLLRVDSALCVKSSPTIGAPKFDANGFAFTWSAEPGAEFSVEYAEDLAGPWMEIPQTITSETGEFSFIDDGSDTGGLSPRRFYRLRRY